MSGIDRLLERPEPGTDISISQLVVGVIALAVADAYGRTINAEADVQGKVKEVGKVAADVKNNFKNN